MKTDTGTTDHRPLTAKVAEPQSKDDPRDVKFVEIPLPPPEMWDELDNSDSQKAGKPQSVPMTEATARKASGSAPQAKLNFISPAFKSVITLLYPFEHPSTGEVAEVTIRRLTVGEVGEILDRLDQSTRDNFDIYAVMTGLPADVLRGLIDIDGEEVSRVCYDFLPRIFRPQEKEPSSTMPNGET